MMLKALAFTPSLVTLALAVVNQNLEWGFASLALATAAAPTLFIMNPKAPGHVRVGQPAEPLPVPQCSLDAPPSQDHVMQSSGHATCPKCGIAVPASNRAFYAALKLGRAQCPGCGFTAGLSKQIHQYPLSRVQCKPCGTMFVKALPVARCPTCHAVYDDSRHPITTVGDKDVTQWTPIQ